MNRVAPALLSLFGTLALSATAHAAAPQTAAGAGERFGPSSKTEKHPKKAVVTQVIDAAFGGAGSYRFCATYGRSAPSDGGQVSATVQRIGGGGSRTVAKLPKTEVRAGRAEVCTAEGVALDGGDLLEWTFKFKKMPKLQPGEFADFGGRTLGPGEPFGAFRIAGDGQDRTLRYDDGANLVFCRTDAGFADLWIRLAEERAADGENAPHVDIDVCNYEGGGSHRPLDPANPSCNGARTFDVFWHDEGGTAFANRANAPRCELVLAQDGERLDGAFACEAMEEIGGGGRVDLLAGSFSCTVE